MYNNKKLPVHLMIVVYFTNVVIRALGLAILQKKNNNDEEKQKKTAINGTDIFSWIELLHWYT